MSALTTFPTAAGSAATAAAASPDTLVLAAMDWEIGRASCRERV